MNPRDKHLLEVFQGLGEGEPASAQTPEPARPAPISGRSESSSGSGRLRALLGDPTRLGVAVAVAVVLSFSLGVLVGRGLGAAPEVSAAGAGPAGDPLAFLEGAKPSAGKAPQRPAAPVEDGLAPFRAAADALADEDNRHTVVAITYDRTESNVDLAWATAYHFADRGLPAGPPYGRGDSLFILVGAAPTTAELLEVRDRVRAQLDPAGRRRQYESAYVAPIDSVLSDR